METIVKKISQPKQPKTNLPKLVMSQALSNHNYCGNVLHFDTYLLERKRSGKC